MGPQRWVDTRLQPTNQVMTLTCRSKLTETSTSPVFDSYLPTWVSAGSVVAKREGLTVQPANLPCSLISERFVGKRGAARSREGVGQ